VPADSDYEKVHAFLSQGQEFFSKLVNIYQSPRVNIPEYTNSSTTLPPECQMRHLLILWGRQHAISLDCLTLKTKAILCLETSVTIYQWTERNNPEDLYV